MTWFKAYGRSSAQSEMRPGDDDKEIVFTGNFTPGDKPITVVLLPALFLGDWLWEKTHQALTDAGYPIIQFNESISLVDRHTARSINRIAARLKEESRKFTKNPLVVAGDSLGGLIAFEFARSFPEETAGLVASGAPGLNLKVNRFAREIAEGASTPEEFADAFLKKLLYDPDSLDIDKERYHATVAELSQPENLSSMAAALKAINRYNSRAVVTEIDTPKLFLWGRQDEITPVEDWEKALPKMKNAKLVAFEECGHGPMFEKPEEFNREMKLFLEDLEAKLPADAPRDEPVPSGGPA